MNLYLATLKKPFVEIRKTLLASLFNMVPIVNFFALGFILSSIDMRLNNKERLAEWCNFFTLFMRGMIIFLVAVCYIMPIVLVYTLIDLIFTTPNLPQLANSNILIATVVVLFITLLMALYLLPYAIANMAYHKQFSAAFKLRKILRAGFTFAYFKNFLLGIILYLLFNTIGITIYTSTYRDINAFSSIFIKIIGFFIIGYTVALLGFLGMFIFIDIIAIAYKQINKI